MAFRIIIIAIISFISFSLSAQHQQISCGNEYHSVICQGSVWSWGSGGFGQFGNSDTEGNMTPQMAIGLDNVISIHTGANHSLALLEDGTVWAWGDNQHGQLGIGSTSSSNVPVQVTTLSDVKSVATGRNFNIALLQDSTVYVWGLNQGGELGNGTFENSLVPIPLQGVPGVASIHAAYFTGFAVLADSTLMVWGSNLFGVAGAGTTDPVIATPVVISNMTGVVSVDGGYSSSAVLKGDGTLWTSGLNQWGQLGLGNFNTPFYAFQQVPSLDSVASIRCGNSHMLAITSAGAVYSWGYNNYGQIGDGTENNRHTPFLIDIPEVVSEVNAFEWNSILLTEQGNYYTWGAIAGGTWAEGNVESSNVPLPKDDVCTVSSISEFLNQQEVSFFPNPAINSITIQASSPEFQITGIEIHNIASQRVFSQFSPLQSGSSIHFGDLPKGLYLLTVHNNLNRITRKLVVD
jgi:alpha-tubulin suppressor-like RCC1 family protein